MFTLLTSRSGQKGLVGVLAKGGRGHQGRVALLKAAFGKEPDQLRGAVAGHDAIHVYIHKFSGGATKVPVAIVRIVADILQLF